MGGEGGAGREGDVVRYKGEYIHILPKTGNGNPVLNTNMLPDALHLFLEQPLCSRY